MDILTEKWKITGKQLNSLNSCLNSKQFKQLLRPKLPVL
jgi:hypothetical protein